MATYKNVESSAHLLLNILTAPIPRINQQTVTLFCFYFLHTYLLLSSRLFKFYWVPSSQLALISSLCLLLLLLQEDRGRQKTAALSLLQTALKQADSDGHTFILLPCSHPSYNWDTKKELSQFASQCQQVHWVLPSKVHQLQKEAVQPHGPPSSFPGLFSNAILTVKSTNCEWQWEGSSPTSGSLERWNASEYANIITAESHTLHKGVMYHASKWLSKILLSFHMAACESRNKESISTMNAIFPNC